MSSRASIGENRSSLLHHCIRPRSVSVQSITVSSRVSLLRVLAHLQDKVKIDYRPVHDQPMDSEMEHVPPKARTY